MVIIKILRKNEKHSNFDSSFTKKMYLFNQISYWMQIVLLQTGICSSIYPASINYKCL